MTLKNKARLKDVEAEEIEAEDSEAEEIEAEDIERKENEGKAIESKGIEGKVIQGREIEGKAIEAKNSESKDGEAQNAELSPASLSPPSSASPSQLDLKNPTDSSTNVLDELILKNRRYYDAFQSLEMGQMQEMWWHNDRVSCIHPGWDIRYGWSEIKESYEMIFEGSSSIRVALGNVQVQAFGKLGFVTCVENLLSEEEGGSGEFLGAVLATNIFEERGGIWKLLHRHTSLFTPDDVDLPEGPLH